MSWFADPKLFIYRNPNTNLYLHRVPKEYGSNIAGVDFQAHELFNFSKHLSLGNHIGNVLAFDFDDFEACFRRPNNFLKYINCEGVVIYADTSLQNCIWSREKPNSPFWSLLGIAPEKPVTEKAPEGKVSDAKNSSMPNTVDRNKAEKEAAADKRVAELEAEISRLQAEVDRKRDIEKTVPTNSPTRSDTDLLILGGVIEALQKQNTDLTSKLVGGGGGSYSAAVDDISKVEKEALSNGLVKVDMLMTMMEALQQQVLELSSKLVQ